MPTQDTSKIKEKIISVLRRRGPCLPVHIANEIQTSILFASAFLSELVSEKKIRMSFMKVGSSPLYLIPGQEALLERFSQYLRSKEKDAFELLKTKKFLIDSEQDPAIRVALRSIKDFAIPFKENNEIIWRYYTEKGHGFKLSKPIVQKKQEIVKEKPIEVIKEPQQKPLDIFGERQQEPIKKPVKKVATKKTTKKTSAYQKKNEKFFIRVKEYLSKNKINISGIEGFSKTDLILKVMDNGVEKLLVAYNKKRILEADILKAYKKASEYPLPYVVLSLGEPSKKLDTLIKSIKNLSNIKKIE